MTNLLTVFRYELRQQFRSKAFLLLTFGLPLLAVIIFLGYREYKDRQDENDKPASPVEESNDIGTRIGYVDLTPEGLFPAPDVYEPVQCNLDENERGFTQTVELARERSRIIKRITSPYCLKGWLTAYNTFEAGEDALDDGDIDVLYVIEPDYVETGAVSQYISGFDMESATSETVLEDYLLRSLLNDLDSQTYESLYMRLRDPALVVRHTITASGETEADKENQNFLVVYGFGLLMMLGIFWGGGYLMNSVVQEKESRIIEIVLSSVSPTPLLAGKVLAMGLSAVIQVVTLLAAFIYIITQAGVFSDSLDGIEIEAGRVALMGLFAALGFLLFGSLMAAIGALSTSMRESQNFVVVVTLPAAVPFFFMTLFVEMPNGTLATFLSLFPLTAPLSMIMRLAVTSVPFGQIALSVALLLVAVAGAIWFAGRLFRVNTLLMGTMPKLRDIPRLLRG
ncbi:MAG: ABC transporter permease [Anaerolineae bacterium]|nr:ABC transporter permease [Anaerolineae bacterium]